MVDPDYLDYLEIVGSGYLSPCSFSWDYGVRLCYPEHTIDLTEVVVVVVKVEQALRSRALVVEELENEPMHTNNKYIGKHCDK